MPIYVFKTVPDLYLETFTYPYESSLPQYLYIISPNPSPQTYQLESLCSQPVMASQSSAIIPMCFALQIVHVHKGSEPDRDQSRGKTEPTACCWPGDGDAGSILDIPAEVPPPSPSPSPPLKCMPHLISLSHHAQDLSPLQTSLYTEKNDARPSGVLHSPLSRIQKRSSPPQPPALHDASSLPVPGSPQMSCGCWSKLPGFPWHYWSWLALSWPGCQSQLLAFGWHLPLWCARQVPQVSHQSLAHWVMPSLGLTHLKHALMVRYGTGLWVSSSWAGYHHRWMTGVERMSSFHPQQEVSCG